MSILFPARLAPLALAVACALPAWARASEFMVSPVRAELRAGALNETITVANRGPGRIRIGVKLMAWSQDPQGKDVYTETTDLVYFPRQMEIEPDARRLIRVGAKAPAGDTERTYRMFIEELPEPGSEGKAQVSVYFRFGVPIFLTPATPRVQADVQEPVLEQGKVSLALKNNGNRHVRVTKVTVSDEAGFSREVSGWYALAGTQRTFTLEVPAAVCRRAGTLSVAIEGEGLSADRKLRVDPARCS